MNLLSIGGSDPSGGAGIQSDIKTFDEFGAHDLTIITAITSQNTSTFGKIQPVSQKLLSDQIDTMFSDFKIDGIKISMVYNSQIIKTIYQKLKDKKTIIVIDPVIKSTTGGMLLEKSALKDFKKYIVPLATVITPNKFEAEFLTNSKINSKKSLKDTVKKIQRLGAKNVVITGIEEKGKITDFVFEEKTQYSISSNKISKTNHGSGGNYSSAILYSLSTGNSLKDAVKFAKKFTYNSIKNARKIGKGIAITENKNYDKLFTELSKSISKFTEITNIYKNIPECQTNFVYSKKEPKTAKEVLGIQGRIVKTGKTVTVAGDLQYGGSKHVATALIEVSKKFPEIRSAVNLRYQNKMISKIRKKFKVSSYDRDKEPDKIKSNGSSVAWGIKNAIKNSKEPPDVIFHKGDFGKEPMIIVFGKNPSNTLEKILKIIHD
ncbi:bifunctional hydroxymethylpyrimidine kinase/phosphomethylpyrimidine kinase [Nitrosopumilus sp. K4]|uniref:bifunctional hydroxymethylpyrimidine kinase/phosphomethylpyrimidine kinase n=1 Tax=Nitrosopumilus sp. K4 TaxID=2795383 RepID=UPI001BA744AA|nr:bifunctional hydroxymethylpyrimidine kinase/phosphomethylpyrimidine kinase [Nitrosopumilus sp. K4]QUC63946.1 bifunctional hydroxymethylpyrimidine kinase/phosphomethylpyrimidine kinase [Nitrosopumilus sp. K4]